MRFFAHDILNQFFRDLNKYVATLIKIIVLYIFLRITCYFEHVSCMKLNEPGHLLEGTFRNWKYLYYSKKPKVCFEEIIQFYTSDLSKSDFAMSKYRYVGQHNFLRGCYWDHWNINPINSAQPYIDVIVNIMLTDSTKDILKGINPNFLKLSDGGFLKGYEDVIQYNTNYLIFLDVDEVVNQFYAYEKNKKGIDEYLINTKPKILDNINRVLKNYRTK